MKNPKEAPSQPTNNNQQESEQAMLHRQGQALAQAIFTWIVSGDARTKPLVEYKHTVTTNFSFKSSVIQGFGFAIGVGGFIGLTQAINYILKLLHL